MSQYQLPSPNTFVKLSASDMYTDSLVDYYGSQFKGSVFSDEP